MSWSNYDNIRNPTPEESYDYKESAKEFTGRAGEGLTKMNELRTEEGIKQETEIQGVISRLNMAIERNAKAVETVTQLVVPVTNPKESPSEVENAPSRELNTELGNYLNALVETLDHTTNRLFSVCDRIEL